MHYFKWHGNTHGKWRNLPEYRLLMPPLLACLPAAMETWEHGDEYGVKGLAPEEGLLLLSGNPCTQAPYAPIILLP